MRVGLVFKKTTCLMLLWVATTRAGLADVPDPTQPPLELKPAPAATVQPLKKAASPVQPEFVLQSVMISPSRKSAVINGIAVSVGDRIKGATISTIDTHHVTLSRNGKSIQLKMLQVNVKQSAAASGSSAE